MFILDHVTPDNAQGKIAEAYAVFPEQVPVPDPLILMSASPDLALAQSNIIRHYMNHDKLDIGLLAMIRYLVAKEFNYRFCIDFNGGLLKMAAEMTDQELEAMRANPDNAPLEKEQRDLLTFVLKVVKTPEEVKTQDLDNLREQGWSDKDIFEAAYHEASMAGASTLYKAFFK